MMMFCGFTSRCTSPVERGPALGRRPQKASRHGNPVLSLAHPGWWSQTQQHCPPPPHASPAPPGPNEASSRRRTCRVHRLQALQQLLHDQLQHRGLALCAVGDV